MAGLIRSPKRADDFEAGGLLCAMNGIDDLLARLTRRCENVTTADELKTRLIEGRQLRVKLGMDPTAPDIHMGHVVVLRKLRAFQDAGHKAVLIIGDYTARIGDP